MASAILVRRTRLGDGAAAGAEAHGGGAVLFQLEEAGDEAGQVAGGRRKPVSLSEADFRGAVEVVGEDGTADGHGLGQGARQPSRRERWTRTSMRAMRLGTAVGGTRPAKTK
jgi:hypothetical protein